MNQNILHVGLDVDDTQYHGSAFNKETGEVCDFKCRPTLKGLLNQLDKLAGYFPGRVIRLCYEASYVGYCLQRDLISHGVHCDVVSPSSIPSPRGKAVKTDRIDAGYLAQFYANDLLTIVQPPDAEQEQDRDFLRSRQKVMQQQTHLRKHLQSVLRQLKGLNQILEEYGEQIEALAAAPRYQQALQSLTCYKGIKNIFALTMITEIGDVKRFPHPRKLVSWIGMDIREYSSGGKHNHFGITKRGNRYIRTAFIEANQRGYRTTRIGRDLKARRKDTAPELINIADRCMRRLSKKGNRLLLAGKHPNKVKVACAREMVGFVWESLNKAAA